MISFFAVVGRHFAHLSEKAIVINTQSDIDEVLQDF